MVVSIPSIIHAYTCSIGLLVILFNIHKLFIYNIDTISITNTSISPQTQEYVNDIEFASMKLKQGNFKGFREDVNCLFKRE